MPGLTLCVLILLWIYSPRLFFQPMGEVVAEWEREGALRGMADHRSHQFTRSLRIDHNHITRRALFLWRLWLGRLTVLVGMCVAARLFLNGGVTGIDLFLVLVGVSIAAAASWGLLRGLHRNLLTRDVSHWLAFAWLQEDQGLPPPLRESLRATQESEWQWGRDQAEQRWELLVSGWKEEVEARQQRQSAMEDWLPGLEMLVGMALALTWLCVPLVQYMDFIVE